MLRSGAASTTAAAVKERETPDPCLSRRCWRILYVLGVISLSVGPLIRLSHNATTIYLFRPQTWSMSEKSDTRSMSGKTDTCASKLRQAPSPNATLDFTDKIFRENIGVHSWEGSPFVIEKYKLVFFTVPKNSCTEWKRLFKRMMNHSDWVEDGIEVHDPKTNGLVYLHHFPKEQQQEFMTSPDWTRAIFLRDPLERLLSAFLNKAISDYEHVHQFCCIDQRAQAGHHNPLFKRQCEVLDSFRNGEKNTRPTLGDFSFETFVEAFTRQCQDVHWAPQSEKLNPQNWQFINFIGHFESLEHDARCLLEKIGAWEDYGASGWGKNGKLSFFQKNYAGHSTSAIRSNKSAFFTPAVLQKASSHLKPDYDFDLLDFKKPSGIDF